MARAVIRQNFLTCNAQALAAQVDDRASLYAQLKLAGLTKCRSLGGVRLSSYGSGPRTPERHHARDDRLFGAARGTHDLARRRAQGI